MLAGTVETAVNALWDAAPLVGDRVAVVGAGMVGLCTARLLAGIPGVEVTVVDVDPGRAFVARALGASFALPADAPAGCDLAVHASSTSAGLQLSLDLLGAEGTVLDLSWYGDSEVTLGSAGRSTRGGWRCGPARSARCRRPGGHGARPPTGFALALAAAARPGLRRAAHRAAPPSTTCPT